MTRAPLFEQRVAVRLNAPGSRYHDATGTVDAHELERVRGTDKALTVRLDDGGHTIAFGDELEPLAHTDNGSTPPAEAQP